MKTLIIGAGPLGSLYACLLHKAGNDVTILARNEHYDFVNEKGVVLVNEFTQEKIIEKVNAVDSFGEQDDYDLVIVIMRKNSIRTVLPVLSRAKFTRTRAILGCIETGEKYGRCCAFLKLKFLLFIFILIPVK